MTVNHAIDLVDGVDPVKIIQPDTKFAGKIFIDNKSQALREVRRDHAGLIIWAERSKLSDGKCGVVVY